MASLVSQIRETVADECFAKTYSPVPFHPLIYAGGCLVGVFEVGCVAAVGEDV